MAGYDVVEKEKSNRLEFRIASGESNVLKSHENQKNTSTTKTDIDVPTSSKNISNKNEINEGPASSIDEALEKVTGGVASSRKRCKSHQRRSHHHRRRKHSQSASSEGEWTLEEDSDYASPPRGRRARGARRYLKPERSRIIQNPEEGKNMYPLVNDSRHGMNYLTYHTADGSGVTYWKQKYLDEKQQAEELRKLLIERQTRNSATRSPMNTNNANRRHALAPEHGGADAARRAVHGVGVVAERARHLRLQNNLGFYISKFFI